MAAYVKYQDFTEQLCKGIHHLHAAGDVVNAAIHSTAPTTTANPAILSGLTQVTGTGYAPIDITNDIAEASGTATLSSGLPATDAVWTAGGAWSAAQYVSLYNDTASSPVDPLICSWDYGSSFTLASGETFTLDLGASIFTIL